MNWPGNCKDSGLYTTAAEKNEIHHQAIVILTFIFCELQPVNSVKLSFVNNGYSMLPSIRTVPVSGHLKQKLNFSGALFTYRQTKYFE